MAKANRDDDEAFEDRPRSRPPQRRPEAEDEEDDRPKRRTARRDDDEDDYDDRPRRSDRGRQGSSRNGMALAGYYCGFLALIFSLGGIALLLGFNIQLGALVPIILFGMVYGLGGLSALLAIIFGAIGLSRAKDTNSGT